MLIFTRRPGESIVIGDKIQLTILKAKGKKASLGITAPKSVRVDRLEIHENRMGESTLKGKKHSQAVLS